MKIVAGLSVLGPAHKVFFSLPRGDAARPVGASRSRHRIVDQLMRVAQLRASLSRRR